MSNDFITHHTLSIIIHLLYKNSGLTLPHLKVLSVSVYCLDLPNANKVWLNFSDCHILQTTSAFRWKWNKLYSIFVVYFWNNIYAFSIYFYPKRLTVHSGYTSFLSVCVPWELNPQTFVLLTQCSTTEPQKHSNMYTSKYIGMYNVRLNRSWRSSTFKNESLQISST